MAKKIKVEEVTGKLPGVTDVNVSFVDNTPKDLNEIGKRHCRHEW